jgi:hypothetical protein
VGAGLWVQTNKKKDYNCNSKRILKGKQMLKHNRRLKCSAVLLMLLACAACKEKAESKTPTSAKAAVGKPVISAVQTEYDFGKVKQGKEVTHTYKIKNIGDKELVIEKTRGS